MEWTGTLLERFAIVCKPLVSASELEVVEWVRFGLPSSGCCFGNVLRTRSNTYCSGERDARVIEPHRLQDSEAKSLESMYPTASLTEPLPLEGRVAQHVLDENGSALTFHTQS
eukprot:1162046-Pelagomonas_calceolata.AAC.14